MVATNMEALLAHRGALVHVDHSHRVERRARARSGARPSAPRGHQEEVATAFLGDMTTDLWYIALQDKESVGPYNTR